MRKYIKPRKGQFILVILSILLSDAMLIGTSVLNQHLIDGVMEQDQRAVTFYAPALILYSVLSAGLFMASKLFQDVFADRLMNDIRAKVFDGVMRRNYRDFISCNTAEYISALTNDLQTIRSLYIGVLYVVILAVSGMIFHAILMFYYQPMVAIFTVIFGIFIAVIPIFLGKHIGIWQERRSESLARLNTLLAEFFSGFEVITSFGIERLIRKRFQECNDDLKKCEYHSDAMVSLSDGLSQFFSILAQTVILVISCWAVSVGQMSFGALVVFITLSSGFCSEFSLFLQSLPMLKGVKPIIDRVNELEGYEATVDTGKEIPALEGSLQVKDLFFGFSKDAPVLRGVAFRLECGGKYALIGESGCGKSTLVRLLTGHYSEYEGQICYDGKELHSLDRSKLHQVVSCIQQEVFLFDDTIKNNICLFQEFSEEQLEHALNQSGVYRFLDSLDQGLEYQVGERGERLSGGQRQRIAIARALIRDTRFLILDEGTSALDAQTAEEIESLLLDIPGLTLLTITHHLRNENAYDCIFHMKDGKLLKI